MKRERLPNRKGISMSNRRYEQFQLSLEKKVVNLFAKVTFGASGAPTLVTSLQIGSLTRQLSKGIASITRNSAGNYTIIFGIPAGALQAAMTDNYYFLLGADANFLDTAAPAAPNFRITNDNSSAGNLIVQFSNSAGTATDPGTGEAVLLNFTLSNSSV
jgi:hypothetical protein